MKKFPKLLIIGLVFLLMFRCIEFKPYACANQCKELGAEPLHFDGGLFSKDQCICKFKDNSTRDIYGS
jgi:hypothetical protein